MSETAKKVIVGMSGGVDSSVSAWLLQQQGYQVEGLFMKNWEEDDGEEYCTAAADLADAQAVCDKLGIELHTVNFAAEYWNNVFGREKGEAAEDAEGLQTVRVLARNMSFLMKSIALGKEQIGLPKTEQHEWTHFIR